MLSFKPSTAHPSVSGWNRDRETEAVVSWNGEGRIDAHVENCRRLGIRQWITTGIFLPAEDDGIPAPALPAA